MIAVPKPERPTPQREWREKAIDTAKRITRLAGRCSKCGGMAPFYQMHGVHIVPVWFGNTCADLDNLECLCVFCHTADNGSAHLSEREFHAWFDAKYPGRREQLQRKAQQVCTLDFEEVYFDLLQKYREMLIAREQEVPCFGCECLPCQCKK